MNKIILPITGILLGIFVFGGYDDSPGAQLLGLIIIIFSIVKIVRNKRKIISS